MSMVSHSKVDFQWSEECKRFCREECPEKKDPMTCIGLCKPAQKMAIAEAKAKIHGAEVPNVLVAKVATAVLPEPVKLAHRLIVFEEIAGVREEVARFNLDEEEREQFLPQWRAIGEARASGLRK